MSVAWIVLLVVLALLLGGVGLAVEALRVFLFIAVVVIVIVLIVRLLGGSRRY